MNSKRMYFVMLGINGVLSLAIVASALAGSSLLKKQSDKLLDAKLQNNVLVEQQTALARANKDIEKYAELEKIAKIIVPQDKDQAATVREIVKIAAGSGIKLGNISFPASTLGQTIPKAAGTVGAKTPPLTQVKPADGLPGLYTMEITVQQDTNSPVSYSKIIDFLSRLEQNRRTAQVTSVTVQPIPKDPKQLTFTLIVNVFIKP